MPLSIRWRLTLWNTLALAIVLLGFGSLVYGLLARALYQRIDRSLMTEFQELDQNPNRDLAHWIDEAKEHNNIYSIIYDPHGTVSQRTEELAAQSVPPAPHPVPGELQFGNATLPIVGHQRVLSGPWRSRGTESTVVLMAPLEEADRELRQLLMVLGTAVPMALVIAGGLGYLLARTALVPMTQLQRLAEAITADRLDRRLPVANPQDELGHLARTINAMIGRLERSFAEIRRFTADASHELRTPLTAIQTEAEVALRKSLDPADCHHLLGSILEECERLTQLTDQLLTLSREDARTTRQVRESVDLAKLVSGVVDTMRPLAEVKGIHLHHRSTSGLSIRGDETRLRQVFYNLLDNAIKYTPRGGTIEVHLGQRNRAALITFRDSGIGIPPEHLPHVFDRFYRIDRARSRAEGGTGLGLSIAQSIVTAHEGRIEMTSTPGQGTMCTVTLPQEPKG